MGETYDKMQNEMNRVPYKVIQGPNNTPRIDIDGKNYTPQEISAMVLQKMKKTAEDFLTKPLAGRGDATVPYYARNRCPQNRRRACRILCVSVSDKLRIADAFA